MALVVAHEVNCGLLAQVPQTERMVTPGRLELPAYGLGNRRSILLSYGVSSNISSGAFRLLHQLCTNQKTAASSVLGRTGPC